MEYKIQIKLSIIRQYEVEAENEEDAKWKALEISKRDMSDCDAFEFMD